MTSKEIIDNAEKEIQSLLEESEKIDIRLLLNPENEHILRAAQEDFMQKIIERRTLIQRLTQQ